MRLVAKRFMITLNEPKNFRRIRKKLHLYSNYVVRKEYLEQLQQYVQETYPKDSEIKNILNKFKK